MIALLVATIGIATGCSGKREITGQVFVVTKGGENVKLGLIGIHVVAERELGEIAGRILNQGATNRANLELLVGLEKEIEAMVEMAPPDFDSPVKQVAETVLGRRLAKTETLMQETPTEILFLHMSPPVTRTDADGVFVVEASETDWLAARGQRRVGASTENYLWLIPLRGVEKRLLVSNDRLIGEGEDLLRILSEVSPSASTIGAESSLVTWVGDQRTAGKLALAAAKAAKENVLAEAKAKAETAEAVIASKLGLSLPFKAGVRGQAGVISLRWVPAGRFMMGSPSGEEGRAFDETQFEVSLSRGFFLAETECTQAQWEAVMGSNPSYFKGSERPVERVSWGQTVEFCLRLTVRQRGEGILPDGWEWRLPTEAEWECAARAGTTGPRHGELDAIAWHAGNSGGQSHPVKQKAANAWGLHDMMGNVWEWCSDWYGTYPTGIVTDPAGQSWVSDRLCRGGSWSRGTWAARSAYRRNVPGVRFNMMARELGFRPVLSSVR
jgi:formylglycine-generating enzyme required for sulfatase activity